MHLCRTRFVLVLLTSAIATGRASAVDETTVRKSPITERIEIQVSAPVDWASEISPARMGLPATLEFKPKSGMPFHILLTPLGQTNEKAIEPLRTQVESILLFCNRSSTQAG
jgi:hypothetical protein